MALPALGPRSGPEPTETGRDALEPGLRQLYTEYFALVWRTLRRLGVSTTALEDAVQDVFLVVHRRWTDFERRSSVKTWIYGIVVRVAKDHRRARSRHAARVERYAEALVSEPPEALAPDEEAERREASRLVQEILTALPDDERAVLVLVELEELSVREAAVAIGIHPSRCQRRLQAARRAFDTALARRVGARRPTR
ncbi:MAG TPA: sigma-70 family RNA polymerase sigma factor [Polyangiaceae bacterium]|nr:sigma-70 family RNA polymerase sigma factor [Polyangiaceae bacterium]